jgi:two-component system sporulation sensor kinase C
VPELDQSPVAANLHSVSALDQLDGKLLKMFIAQNPAVLWAVDKALRITMSEGAGLAAIRHDSQNVIGQTLYEYFKTDDPDHLASAHHRDALQGTSARYNYERSGRMFDSYVRPLIDADGHISGVIGLALDITDQRSIDRELRAQINRFETLARSAPVGIFLLDRNGVMTYCNQRWTQITGQTLEQSKNGGYLAVVHPDDRERIAQSLQAAVRESKMVRDECRIITTDGTIRYVIGDAVPEFDANGQLQNFVGTLTDVTDLTHAQTALRQSEQHLALATLAGHMAHEINNPLAGIKNAFLLIKDAVQENHPYYSYVRRIEVEIDRIARIVRQTLDAYRPEPEEPIQMLLEQTMTDVLAFMQPKAAAAGVTIAANLPPDVEIALLPDSSFRQIAYNLLANAIEASPREGVIEVSLTAGERIELTVADEGPGVEPAQLERIFEPLFTTKPRGHSGGAGLGLAITRSLVQMMGGTIRVRNAQPHGAIFTVDLPRGGAGAEQPS